MSGENIAYHAADACAWQALLIDCDIQDMLEYPRIAELAQYGSARCFLSVLPRSISSNGVLTVKAAARRLKRYFEGNGIALVSIEHHHAVRCISRVHIGFTCRLTRDAKLLARWQNK